MFRVFNFVKNNDLNLRPRYHQIKADVWRGV